MTSSQTSRLFFQDGIELLSGEARRRAIANAERYANRSTLRPLKDLQLIQAVRPWLRAKDGGLCRRETHILTEAGARLVQQWLDEQGRGERIRWSPAVLEIDGTNQAHAEAIVDCSIAFTRAVTSPLVFWGWKDDRELMRLAREGATTFQAGVPDAIFVITATVDGRRRHAPFFLELDRGTETVTALDGRKRDWTAKIERYERYFAGGYPADPLFRGLDQPPVVLVVATSARRLGNLMEATLAVTPSRRYRFTTLGDLIDGPSHELLTGAIWQTVAGDRLPLMTV